MHQFKGIHNPAKHRVKTKKQRENLAANMSCQWALNLLWGTRVNLTWVKRAAPLADRNTELGGADPANTYTCALS